jgi:hypothetical protein
MKNNNFGIDTKDFKKRLKNLKKVRNVKNIKKSSDYDGMTVYTFDVCGNVDEYGNPVERSKSEYPYSYSGFITYRNGENKEANSTIYSDRLLQWDYKKYNILSKKHFGNEGQIFYSRSPKKIEAFLKDWFSKDLKIIFIMEYCNVSNGFPYWRFDVKMEES